MFYSSDENYEHNKKILANLKFGKKDPIAKDGFIEDQDSFKDLNYGCKTSDYNGCGWVAGWNVMHALGKDVDKAELIRDLEPGTLLCGVAGTKPNFIKQYLQKLGYNVQQYTKPHVCDKANPEQGVIYYMRKNITNGAHYVCFTKAGKNKFGDNLYAFHNEGGNVGAYWEVNTKDNKQYVKAPVLAMDEFIEKAGAGLVIFYVVR